MSSGQKKRAELAFSRDIFTSFENSVNSYFISSTADKIQIHLLFTFRVTPPALDKPWLLRDPSHPTASVLLLTATPTSCLRLRPSSFSVSPLLSLVLPPSFSSSSAAALCTLLCPYRLRRCSWCSSPARSRYALPTYSAQLLLSWTCAFCGLLVNCWPQI